MSYKKAIIILSQLETFEQYREVCIKLAQKHPSILVKLTEKPKEEENVYVKEVALLLQKNGNLERIEHLRERYALDLKQAKDMYEYVFTAGPNPEHMLLPHTRDFRATARGLRDALFNQSVMDLLKL
jgi:hypothetical protein